MKREIFAKDIYKSISSENDLAAKLKDFASENTTEGEIAGCSVFIKELWILLLGIGLAIFVIYQLFQSPIITNISIVIFATAFFLKAGTIYWWLEEHSMILSWLGIRKSLLLPVEIDNITIDRTKFKLFVSSNAGNKIKFSTTSLREVSELYQALM